MRHRQADTDSDRNKQSKRDIERLKDRQRHTVIHRQAGRKKPFETRPQRKKLT